MGYLLNLKLTIFFFAFLPQFVETGQAALPQMVVLARRAAGRRVALSADRAG